MDRWNVGERMRKDRIPGLSIAFIEDGRIVSRECRGERTAGSGEPVGESTMFNACSISKFAAGMVALLLVEERVLHLDQAVNQQLLSWRVPDHPEFDSGDVTLRRLLGHQGGFADPDGSFGTYGKTLGTPSMAELLKGLTPYRQQPAALAAKPGSRFIYSDTGFCILQLLIEEATGEAWDKLMRTKIFEPLQMANSRFVTNASEIRNGSAAGHNKRGIRLEGYPIYPFAAAAGLWSTPTDLALLIAELMFSLQGKGKLGISAETAREMIKPQGGFKWAGLGVFMEDSNGELELSSLGWGEGFQCMMTAYPGKGRGAVLMMNADPGVHQTDSLLGYIANMWQQENSGA